MKSTDQNFIIPFVGLKIGTYEFEYKIDESFFALMEYSIIHSGELDVTLEFEKKETMMLANFHAAGKVTTNCDRCDTPLELEVSGEFKLIYKFGTEESEDESLVVLHPDDFELDIRDAIYELITVCLPPRVVHEPGECDEEMMGLLQKYTVNMDDEDEDDEDWDDEEEDIPGIDDFDPKDPRWSSLKNLN